MGRIKKEEESVLVKGRALPVAISSTAHYQKVGSIIFSAEI